MNWKVFQTLYASNHTIISSIPRHCKDFTVPLFYAMKLLYHLYQILFFYWQKTFNSTCHLKAFLMFRNACNFHVPPIPKTFLWKNVYQVQIFTLKVVSNNKFFITFWNPFLIYTETWYDKKKREPSLKLKKQLNQKNWISQKKMSQSERTFRTKNYFYRKKKIC